MTELIEAIRAAVADGATPEQKAAGADACRTILTALDVKPGQPFAVPGVPRPGPLSGLPAEQLLDLVIARLRSMAEARDRAGVVEPPPAAPRIQFVSPPPLSRRRR
jgi:hypothetical protein